MLVSGSYAMPFLVQVSIFSPHHVEIVAVGRVSLVILLLLKLLLPRFSCRRTKEADRPQLITGMAFNQLFFCASAGLVDI